jgi:hypothetical protein
MRKMREKDKKSNKNWKMLFAKKSPTIRWGKAAFKHLKFSERESSKHQRKRNSESSTRTP